MALATSLASWISAGLLFYVLRKRGDILIDDSLKKKLVPLAASAALMVAATLFMTSQTAFLFEKNRLLNFAV